MPIFEQADIVDMQQLVIDLAFADPYRVKRLSVPVVKDDAGNPKSRIPSRFSVVEEGIGRLRTIESNSRSSERVIAERMGWTVSAVVDLPVDTIVSSDDTIEIGQRTFHVHGVVKDHNMAVKTTAMCEERSH